MSGIDQWISDVTVLELLPQSSLQLRTYWAHGWRESPSVLTEYAPKDPHRPGSRRGGRRSLRAVFADVARFGCDPRWQPGCAGVPVVGDLDCVAEHVQSCRYCAVSMASKSGWSGRRLHQLVWDLEGAGVELVVDPLNSLASGGG